MRAKIGILVCETLRREVAAAVKAERLDEVEVVAFPSDCGRPETLPGLSDEILHSCESRFDHILLLGGSCAFGSQNRPAGSAPGRITRLGSCFELFLPGPTVQHLLLEGAYLMTPGWLATWRERMGTWGFDASTARDFFAESCARLVLLDTATDASSPEKLTALAAFVDRPCEIVPVGLDLLRLSLAGQVRPWSENSGSAPSSRATVPQTDQLATYAMVFDVMGHLAGLETEERVVREIFDLFDRDSSI